MATKRALPAGIRELPDGTFRVRRQVRGSRQDRRAKTYDDAMAIYRDMFADNARATAPDRRMTVGRLVAHYVEQREDLAASSRRSFESLIRNYIAPRPIAKIRIVDLAEEDVVLFLRQLRKATGTRTGRPLSPQTVAQVRKLLSAAMAQAERTGQVPRNPVRLARGPQVIRQPIEPPTVAEMKLIRGAVVASPYAALYAVMMQTGMRLGEALALRWREVVLDGPRPYVAVTGTLDEATGIRRERPKTDSSVRRLRLQPSLILALKGRRAIQDKDRRRAGRAWHDRDGLVFTTRTGRPVYGKNLRGHLERAAASSGATTARLDRGVTTKLRWHDFRHAWATLALEAGVPLHTVSQLLGHRSITITANTYGHVTDAMRDEAADRVARVLG